MYTTHQRSFILAFSATLMTSAAAYARDGKHFDIWLQPVGSTIVTGSITEGTPGKPINALERVFGAELGEDIAFPYSAFEPGFQSLASPLTAGMIWSFNIVASLGTWTGKGFDAASETMTIDFGPASATTGAGFVSGFSFTGFADGLMHDHFDFTLNPGSPLAGAAPADGIYLLTLEFLGVNGAIAYSASDPVFLVFNLNMDEREHEAAIEWTQQNLAPAPGALAMLAMTGLFAARGRRRSTM